MCVFYCAVRWGVLAFAMWCLGGIGWLAKWVSWGRLDDSAALAATASVRSGDALRAGIARRDAPASALTAPR